MGLGDIFSNGFKILDPTALSGATFGDVVMRLLTFLLIVAGILAVFYLVWAGLQYITAGGDTTKATTARQGIVNAIIGIVIILLSIVIVQWVGRIVGAF